MQKMTMNLTEVLHGNYLQVVTCVFTHLDIGHIFSNMFTVYFLGRFLASAPQITPLRYVTIALGSGISGSIGTLSSPPSSFTLLYPHFTLLHDLHHDIYPNVHRLPIQPLLPAHFQRANAGLQPLHRLLGRRNGHIFRRRMLVPNSTSCHLGHRSHAPLGAGNRVCGL